LIFNRLLEVVKVHVQFCSRKISSAAVHELSC